MKDVFEIIQAFTFWVFAWYYLGVISGLFYLRSNINITINNNEIIIYKEISLYVIKPSPFIQNPLLKIKGKRLILTHPIIYIELLLKVFPNNCKKKEFFFLFFF